MGKTTNKRALESDVVIKDNLDTMLKNKEAAAKRIDFNAIVKSKKVEPKITLVSYTVKAIIPTGQYSNIQPEIVIKALSLEEAKNFVMPHIDELFTKYLNFTERKVESVKTVNVPVVNIPGEMVKAPLAVPVQTPVYLSGKTAIRVCVTEAELDIYKEKVGVSKKLNEVERVALLNFIEERREIIKGQ